MLPFIRGGDVVHVEPAGRREIAVGDVVCYAPAAGVLVVHRVIVRRGDRLVTRGDALSHREILPGTHVLGRVVAVERDGRLRRLDTPFARATARAMVTAAPLVRLALPVAAWLRRLRRGAHRA